MNIQLPFDHWRTIFLIAVAAAAMLIITITAERYWSGRRIASLENEVRKARESAGLSQRNAAEAEAAANEFKQKITYLESRLSGLKEKAETQDEKLKNINDLADRARVDVERSRSVRSVGTNEQDLCDKLSDLGHPCD